MDNPATMLSIIVRVVVRGVVGALAFAASAGVAVLTAIPFGDGNRTMFVLAAFVFFVGLGWALLPAYRFARIPSLLLDIAWLLLGIGLVFSPHRVYADLLFLPWLLASGTLVACLILKPPQFTPNVWSRVREAGEHEANRSIDADVLLARFTGLLAADHLQR